MSRNDLVDQGPADKGFQPRSTQFWLLAHALAWGLCLELFVFGVPRIEAIFKDFAIPLPRAASFVIWAARQAIALLCLILVLIGVDWFVIQSLFKRGEIEVSQTWSTLMFATPVVLIALTLITLSLPLFTLDFGLGG